MNNDLISVIVPCYNVEKYLEKCVDSIVNQSYQNLEIILVDDGAKDSTPQLCDKLALTDPRIKVLHKVNGGLSDARNAGFDICTGKYVCFFDSDDWIELDTIKTAYDKMICNNLDLVVWGYSADFVDDNEALLNKRLCAVNGICAKSNDNQVLLQRDTLGLCGYAWNKLYKADIIKDNNLCFEKGISLVEDILFNSLYFSKCEKIEFIDFIGNHYIQRGRVTLGTKRYENVFELKLMGCEARENILKHFGITNNKIMAPFYYGALKPAVNNIKTQSDISKKDKIKKLKLFIADKNVQCVAKKALNVPLKQRVLVVLIRLRLACILLKL